jgi:hypothetical protein
MNNSTVHLAPQIVTQQESAAHIAALEAENARLRALLAEVATSDAGPCMMDDLEYEWYLTYGWLRRARAALAGGPDER